MNLEDSSVLSSKNYVKFVKCWLGLVELEPFCQDPRCRLKWTLRVAFLQDCHVAAQAESPQYNIPLKMEQSKSSYGIWPHKGMFLCRITGLVIFQRSSSFPVCTSHSPCPSVKYQIRLNNQIFLTIFFQTIFNILVLLMFLGIDQEAARIFMSSPSSCHKCLPTLWLYSKWLYLVAVSINTATPKKKNQPKSQKSWRKCEIWEMSCFGCTSMLALSKEILIMLMSSALAFELF